MCFRGRHAPLFSHLEGSAETIWGPLHRLVAEFRSNGTKGGGVPPAPRRSALILVPPRASSPAAAALPLARSHQQYPSATRD